MDPWPGENVFLSPDKKTAQRLQHGQWDRTIVYLNSHIGVNRPLRLGVIRREGTRTGTDCLKFGIVATPVLRYDFQKVDSCPVRTIAAEVRENSIISLIVFSGELNVVAYVDGKEVARLDFSSHSGLLYPFLILSGQVSAIMILDENRSPMLQRLAAQSEHPVPRITDLSDFPPLAPDQELPQLKGSSDNVQLSPISDDKDVAVVCNGKATVEKEGSNKLAADPDSDASSFIHPDLVSQLLQLCEDPADNGDKLISPGKASHQKKWIQLSNKSPDEIVVRKKRIAHLFPNPDPDDKSGSEKSFPLNPDVPPFTPTDNTNAQSKQINGTGKHDNHSDATRDRSSSQNNHSTCGDGDTQERKWYTHIAVKYSNSTIIRKKTKEEADYIFSSQFRVGDSIFMKVAAGESHTGGLFFGMTRAPLLKLDTSQLPPNPLDLKERKWAGDWFVSSDLCDAGHALDGVLVTRTETGIRITGWKLDYHMEVFPEDSQSIVYPFICMSGDMTSVHVSSDLKVQPLSDLHKNRLKLLFFLIPVLKGMDTNIEK